MLADGAQAGADHAPAVASLPSLGQRDNLIELQQQLVVGGGARRLVVHGGSVEEGAERVHERLDLECGRRRSASSGARAFVVAARRGAVGRVRVPGRRAIRSPPEPQLRQSLAHALVDKAAAAAVAAAVAIAVAAAVAPAVAAAVAAAVARRGLGGDGHCRLELLERERLELGEQRHAHGRGGGGRQRRGGLARALAQTGRLAREQAGREAAAARPRQRPLRHSLLGRLRALCRQPPRETRLQGEHGYDQHAGRESEAVERGRLLHPAGAREFVVAVHKLDLDHARREHQEVVKVEDREKVEHVQEDAKRRVPDGHVAAFRGLGEQAEE
mmetsp:Transcript_20118/g.66599  ORF Transcript_20118/g.66599 Transcript_20118/m.66599 type:complete len:329 (+) Transcript_20118:247-1233(+)